MTWLNVQVQTINTSFIHFPFNNFRYFLTLFSKFFSSFLHSTCSLSVSRQYLALDGIYHPLGLQSQATRLVGSAPYVFYLRHRTGLSPSMVQDSTWIIPARTLVTTPIDYNSLPTRSRDFQVELFPLHSPLLRESWLVSFPPLSYMLKFSGSSCLISGPIFKNWFLTNLSGHTVNLPHSLLAHNTLQTRKLSFLPKQSPCSRPHLFNSFKSNDCTGEGNVCSTTWMHAIQNDRKHQSPPQNHFTLSKERNETTLASGVNRHWNRHASRSTRKRNLRSKIWWFTYSAIRITYRISLRSSSLREPRHPLLKVVRMFLVESITLFFSKNSDTSQSQTCTTYIVVHHTHEVIYWVD